MRTAYRRASRAVWRHAHERVLIRVADQPEIVVLTGTGEDLWLILSATMTEEELAGELADTYDAAPDEILTGVRPALDDLVARGVLDRVVDG